MDQCTMLLGIWVIVGVIGGWSLALLILALYGARLYAALDRREQRRLAGLAQQTREQRRTARQREE